ncbi:toll/interleukin-1 receptor domain-containing protein [Dactylosporangium sp. NPDC049525]|uniref:toll/interleukin-1 receptor domain-containing protein n=1 Tax=Dactylosporangium sp. NPDC049525 TaxID=3154730 RepID=UPI00343177D9
MRRVGELGYQASATDPAVHRHPSGAEVVVPAAPQERPHVFISYSRSDRKYVKKLHRHLAEHRITAWDDRQIPTGVEFPAEIQRRIETCRAFLLVLSPAAVESSWVARELFYATNLKKRVLPIMLEACNAPFLVAGVQYEDVTDGTLPGMPFVSTLRSLLR